MTTIDATTPPTLMLEGQVEHLAQLPKGSLRQDRHHGTIGLPYVKLGRRVRYRADDVAAFIEAHTITPSGSPARQQD